MEPAEQPPRATLAKPWMTYALIAANIIAFVFEIAAGADPVKPTAQKMIELGGDFAPLTLHGEPWRLVTSMFLHYGLMHIALNMVCLAQGRVVESLFGRFGFASIYLVSGLAGGIASMARSTLVVSAGASGAVFGVYGAFGAYLVFRRSAVAADIWQKTTRRIGMFVAINLVYGMSTPGVDMSAHIGGLIAGFALGAALLVGAGADAQRTWRAIGLILAGLALTAVGLVVVPAPQDVTPVLTEFERVEHDCLATWNQLLQQSQDGTIKEPELARQIESEVIAPWKAIRAKVIAIDHPPMRLAPLWDLEEKYLSSRLAEWEAFVVLISTPRDQREDKRAEYVRKAEQTKTEVEALKAEIARLNHK